MAFNDGLVLALLLIALVLGYFLGLLRGNKVGFFKEKKGGGIASRQYIEGVNQLLNEQPDAALDSFIDSFDVNSDTLETHFALGVILRKRGEVDRAIRIHQNLLARPNLNLEQQHLVQFELALDYMSSGLLDRAEALFEDLSKSTFQKLKFKALEKLVDIYQGESEW